MAGLLINVCARDKDGLPLTPSNTHTHTHSQIHSRSRGSVVNAKIYISSYLYRHWLTPTPANRHGVASNLAQIAIIYSLRIFHCQGVFTVPLEQGDVCVWCVIGLSLTLRSVSKSSTSSFGECDGWQSSWQSSARSSRSWWVTDTHTHDAPLDGSNFWSVIQRLRKTR